MVGVWCNLSGVHTVKEGRKGTGKHTCSRQMTTKAQKGKKSNQKIDFLSFSDVIEMHSGLT